MKTFLDIFSIAIFFIAYKYYDIFYATAAIIITYTISFILNYFNTKKLDKTMLITWLMVSILGGLTLVFHNASFIKYKPTLVYWFFAIAFHISPYMKDEKTIMERMISHQITLPKNVWDNLSRFWMFLFYILGLVNIYVAYDYTTDQWVNFKTFGILTLLLVATIGQVLYISKHIKPEDIKNNKDKIN